MAIVDILSKTGVQSVLYNESLARHCTWRIGGPADALAAPGSAAELAALLRVIAEHGLRFVVVGDGSNVLFDDAGFRGVVIVMGRRLSGWSVSGTSVRVQAGTAVPRLARAAQVAGLSGLEHTCGIPGTLGGLVAMNGGSLGRCIGEVVKTVRCVDASGTRIELGREACGFSYRRSVFLERPWVITEAVLELEKGNRDAIAAAMLAILRDRRSKYPRRLPNCGSVFKNHPDIYAAYGPPGKVIEDLGFKGVAVGDAQVSERHANFIVNRGQATAADVLTLIGRIREAVLAKTGVRPECEVRYIDPAGGNCRL